jgi:hypothetical protein
LCAQGGTRFSYLNITVEAKRGRALFWPSVLDSDPSAVRVNNDHRTTHEAITVTKGQKFAANMWLHQYDFQTALGAGCKNEDLADWKPHDPAHADTPPAPDDFEEEEGEVRTAEEAAEADSVRKRLENFADGAKAQAEAAENQIRSRSR